MAFEFYIVCFISLYNFLKYIYSRILLFFKISKYDGPNRPTDDELIVHGPPWHGPCSVQCLDGELGRILEVRKKIGKRSPGTRAYVFTVYVRTARSGPIKHQTGPLITEYYTRTSE